MFDTDELTALFSPAANADPHPIHARLRERAPVVKAEQVGLWTLSRYDDVAFALKRPDLFSSQRDAALTQRLMDPRLQDSVEFDLLNESSIVAVDPPAHTRLRKLINSAFTPRAINRLETRIRQLARAHVDDILREQSFDLIEALAVPLPVIVISEMLGVDPARRAAFKRWSDDLLVGSRSDGDLDDLAVERVIRSRREFVDYFREIIELRRRAPQDDLLGDLVRAEVEREMLSPDEVLTMAVLLMLAGNETTTNLVWVWDSLLCRGSVVAAGGEGRVRGDVSALPRCRAGARGARLDLQLGPGRAPVAVAPLRSRERIALTRSCHRTALLGVSGSVSKSRMLRQRRR
jgi:cytochrome P450